MWCWISQYSNVFFCVFVASINASLCCRVYALKARGTGKPGPAEEAGIRVNDIIVSIDDTEGINSTEQVRSLMITAFIHCGALIIDMGAWWDTLMSNHTGITADPSWR